jgi:hypothetical protein
VAAQRRLGWGTEGAWRNAREELDRRARQLADLELQLEIIVRRTERGEEQPPTSMPASA